LRRLTLTLGGADGAARHPYLSSSARRSVPSPLLEFQALRHISSVPILFQMDVPRRKTLPHEIPLWIDPQKEIYFITINCKMRGNNQLAGDKIAVSLFETVRHRQEQGIWWPHIFLLMPDHLHTLISFPPSDKTVKQIVGKWKEWTAKTLGIIWQRDFFEHRLRRDENRQEKGDYILQNPVRKKLVSCIEDWPFVYFADGRQSPW
jgi:putative transposase